MRHASTPAFASPTRRWLGAIAASVLAVVLAACGGQPSRGSPTAHTGAAGKGPVARVGAALSLSGPAAAAGSAQRNGVKLAEEEINASQLLGATRLEVLVEDAPDRASAAELFQKFINTGHVVAIVGPTSSNDALAVDPIAQQAGVPVVAISNSAGGLTEIGSFIFRDSLPESQVTAATVKMVKSRLQLRRAALLYADTDPNRGSARGFQQALEHAGVEIVSEQTFLRGETDFSAQLVEITSADPDALFVSAPPSEAAAILMQARQLGPPNLPIVGSGAFASLGVIRRAGKAAEGLIVGVGWTGNNPTPTNQRFIDAYRARFNTDPDQFAAQAYTGVYLVATAVKNASTTRDVRAVRDSLAHIKDVDTPLGKFSFSDRREPTYLPSVAVVRGGRLEPFGP